MKHVTSHVGYCAKHEVNGLVPRAQATKVKSSFCGEEEEEEEELTAISSTFRDSSC
jgi:hypothetical protein